MFKTIPVTPPTQFFEPPIPVQIQVPLEYVIREPGRFINFPIWQRDEAWTQNMGQWLIESALTISYIPAIYTYPDAESGRNKLWVFDGQQRLKAILAFVNNQFKTPKSKHFDPSLTFNEGNKLYAQLSPAAQKHLMSLPLTFLIFEGIPVERIKQLYRALQLGVPLTRGEILKSYDSHTRNFALELCEHPFFREFYQGNKKRGKDLSMSLYVIAQEIGNINKGTDAQRTLPIFVNVDGYKLNTLSVGNRDQFLTEDVKQTVGRRLENAMHLFADAKIKHASGVFLISQAIALLEIVGVNVGASTPGCLTSWYNHFNETVHQHHTFGIFSHILKYKDQLVLWQNELVSLLDQDGLVFVDREASFAHAERIQMWCKTRNSCPNCGDSIHHIGDIALHRFRRVDGYSSGETCGSPVNLLPPLIV